MYNALITFPFSLSIANIEILELSLSDISFEEKIMIIYILYINGVPSTTLDNKVCTHSSVQKLRKI